MVCAIGSLTFKHDFSIKIKSAYETSFFQDNSLQFSIRLDSALKGSIPRKQTMTKLPTRYFTALTLCHTGVFLAVHCYRISFE